MNSSISAHHQNWIKDTTKSIDSAKDVAKQALFDNLDLVKLIEDPENHLGEIKLAVLSSIFPYYKDCLEISQEFGQKKAAIFHGSH